MIAEKEPFLNETVKDETLVFKDFYPVNPPFGYSGIEIIDEKGKMGYMIIEPLLSDDEWLLLADVKKLVTSSQDVSLDVLDRPKEMKEYLVDKVRAVYKKYENRVSPDAEDKILYYLFRDFMGYGKIDVMMKDPFIEDVSCNGQDLPIYIWHTIHESMPTNIIYETKDDLSKVITRLVYKTGQQISVAKPILEGTLPEGYRAHLTLDEVSKKGDTFTIRKFRSNPFTIVDLVKKGTLNTQMGAYLWNLVEYKRSLMVCGAVASGKTALLNSVGMYIKPEMKVVTIEEVRELRLHENWIPMTSRPSFQPGVQEISLFDLLKSALRQRPDYIIVGEVRGDETYTLFQSMAVGHGGLCSIHADSLDSVLKRLRTRPMSIPEMMLPLMNSLVMLRRIRIDEDVVRRVDEIAEIVPPKDTDDTALLAPRFKWVADGDKFEYIAPKRGEPDVIKQISEIYQVPRKSIESSIKTKEMILDWMCNTDVKDYKEVSKIVRNYYLKPDEVQNLARMDILNGK